ncbi:retrotransposon-like protein 1 [Branchiostoma belcheri]|nr:retrotransposon-like protein 1 [Branchiostoma belcheri]
MTASHLTPKQRTKITKLVGNRCLVSCKMDDQPVLALWDTGAQVSIMTDTWREKNLPEINQALPVRPQRAAALVNLIEEFSVPNPAGVRVGRKRVRLPRGATVQVRCRIPRGSVEEKQIMLFEPDEAGDWPTGLEVGPALIPVNSTGMIKLRRVPEGSQHPTTEDRRPVSEEPQQTPQQAQVNTVQAEDELWDPPVDLSHLSEEQRKIVKQMLREESAPLYKEVREYIEDLINQGWITKSKSPYSSPMVCVRKKDGSMRLCIDYRALNEKTMSDRQPLPRIQDILNRLKGSTWFSVLDQGKPTIKAT